MGLAASQARLLTITARLADNELRSQTINNAKMRLATQSSQASENYVNALNNATMKFTNYALDGESQTQNLTFNALTAYSSYNNQYGLINSSGQLLVSESEALLFEKSNGNLDSYLKYHGLEYKTTYYENVGAITNDGYIEPFNYISVEDMKTYFEEYNSYENSQEVEKYQNAYNTYLSSTNSLQNVAKTVMTSFLTSGKSQNILKHENGAFSLDYGSASTLPEMINTLKNALNNPANSYAFNNPIISQLGLNNDGTLDNYKEILNTLNINTEEGTFSSSEICELIKVSDTEYQLDNDITITLDAETGNVTSVTCNLNAQEEDGTTNTVNGPRDVSLAECINGIQANISGFAKSYKVSYNDKGEMVVTSTTAAPLPTDPAEAASIANDILTEIITDLVAEYSIAFATVLYGGDQATNTANQDIVQNQYGVNLNENVEGTTKPLSQYYYDYANAEDVYLGTIFDNASIEQVQKDLENGKFTDAEGNEFEISYRDLTDIDFVLRYMESQGLQPSETFLTVAKIFVVDQIIDEYGSPKYAWVDSTDPDNNGNADAKAQWYTNLFNRMKQGYKALENGLASSPEWIEYALESGIVTMEQVDGEYHWQGLDYKACARITEETDDAAVAKAEAEYSRAMNDIEAKDNIYDLELKNIDTEHTSLQTEYDSIKGVISKNIERTFNFYKNA